MSDSPVFDNVNNPKPTFEVEHVTDKPEPIYGEVETPDTEFKPVIPRETRTVAYFAVLIVGAICTLGGALAPIWLNEAQAGDVALTLVAVLGFISTIGGIFGVAYRPTR